MNFAIEHEKFRLKAVAFLDAHGINANHVPEDWDLDIRDGKVSLDVYEVDDDGHLVVPPGWGLPVRKRITVDQVAEWPQ